MVIQDEVFQLFTTFNKDGKRYQRCNFCSEEMAGHDRRRLMEHIYKKCKNVSAEIRTEVEGRYAAIYHERNRRKAAFAARRDASGFWDNDLDSDAADAAPSRRAAGLRPFDTAPPRTQGVAQLDEFLANINTPYGGAPRDLDFEMGITAPTAKVPITKAFEAQRLLQLFLEQQSEQSQEDKLLYRLLVRRELRLEEQLKASKQGRNTNTNFEQLPTGQAS